jgi:hypothetical protein
MALVPMQDFFAAGARGLVDAQFELDERGRDSLDAFDDTGVPPTVLTWSTCRLRCPVGMSVTGKTAAGERTAAAVEPGGRGSLVLSFRYLLSPQGVDDPRPSLPASEPG